MRIGLAEPRSASSVEPLSAPKVEPQNRLRQAPSKSCLKLNVVIDDHRRVTGKALAGVDRGVLDRIL